MKFYYKERTAKNQCKVLSEEKGMLTIQMRNGGRFLVSKKNVLSEVFTNEYYDSSKLRDAKKQAKNAIDRIEKGMKYGEDMMSSVALCFEDAIKILKKTLDYMRHDEMR